IGPGLEPPGGGADRQTASASAGSGATGVTGPMTAKPSDSASNPNPMGTQTPATMQPAATAGSSATNTTPPTATTQDAGPQPGQSAAGRGAADSPSGKDEDAGVP